MPKQDSTYFGSCTQYGKKRQPSTAQPQTRIKSQRTDRQVPKAPKVMKLCRKNTAVILKQTISPKELVMAKGRATGHGQVYPAI